MTRRKPFFSLLKLGLSVLGGLACLALLAGVWTARPLAISALNRQFSGIEKAAQGMRDAVEMGINRIDSMEKLSAGLAGAVVQAGQSGSDPAALFPLPGALQYVSTVHSVRDISHNLRALVEGERELVLATNNLPGVAMSIPGRDHLEPLDQKVDQLWTASDQLSRQMAAARQGDAGAIPQILPTLDEIKALRAAIRGELLRLDGQLATVQAQAAALRRAAPRRLTIAAILATILLAWLAFSQWLVARQAWRELRR